MTSDDGAGANDTARMNAQFWAARAEQNKDGVEAGGAPTLLRRLRGRYPVGPIGADGEPEFGWRRFPEGAIPRICLEAADAIEKLMAGLGGLVRRWPRSDGRGGPVLHEREDGTFWLGATGGEPWPGPSGPFACPFAAISAAMASMDERERAWAEAVAACAEAAGVCLRCTECAGSEHHWMPHDAEPAMDGRYLVVCKHCHAVAGECQECSGSGSKGGEGDGEDEGEPCDVCLGEGYIYAGTGFLCEFDGEVEIPGPPGHEAEKVRTDGVLVLAATREEAAEKCQAAFGRRPTSIGHQEA